MANRARLRKKGFFPAILLRDDILRSCCIIDDVFSISCAIARVVVSIASFVLANLARSVKFYDLGHFGACRGERMVLRRQQNNSCDTNCVDVRILHGRLLLGNLKVAVATPLMRSVATEVTGYVSRYQNNVLCTFSNV